MRAYEKHRPGYAGLRTKELNIGFSPNVTNAGVGIFGPHDCDAKSLYHANRNQRAKPCFILRICEDSKAFGLETTSTLATLDLCILRI